jgi:hypothetical protein
MPIGPPSKSPSKARWQRRTYPRTSRPRHVRRGVRERAEHDGGATHQRVQNNVAEPDPGVEAGAKRVHVYARQHERQSGQERYDCPEQPGQHQEQRNGEPAEGHRSYNGKTQTCGKRRPVATSRRRILDSLLVAAAQVSRDP